jgi:WD40 repeat protein
MVQFSQDETTVFSATAGGHLTRWNAHQLGHPVVQPLFALPHAAISDNSGHGSTAAAFSFDDTGHFVLRTAGGVDAWVCPLRRGDSGSAVTGQAEAGTLPHSPPSVVLKLGGHTAPVTSVAWGSLPNTCFTASLDHTVGIHTLFRATDA